MKPNELSASNALLQIGRTAGTLLGPALGGYLIAKFSISAALTFDAATFAIAAISILLIRQRRDSLKVVEETSPSQTSQIRQITAGFRFLWQEQGMLTVVLLFAIINALNNVEAVLVPLLVRVTLKLSAEQFGFMTSLLGVGSLAGTLLTGLFGNSIRKPALVICVSIGLFGLSIIAMGLAQEIWQLYSAYFLFGFSFIIAELVSSTMWLHMVPVDLRGRVFSVLSTLAMGLNPLGFVLAGVLGSVFGVREGIWIGGGAVAILSIVALLLPSVRSLDGRMQELLNHGQESIF